MRIIITGATGLIGKTLCARLHTNYEIVALSRNPQKAKSALGSDIKIVRWDTNSPGEWAQYIDNAFAVINLTGEPIASGRWTQAKKQHILQSRINSTKAIADAIESVKNKPSVLIQASAVGYYGFGRQEALDESTRPGSGFLADVCKQWEETAKAVERFGVRCAVIRSGLVLSRYGGALPRLAKPFKFFLGGYPGTGSQWVSWITIDDEIAAIRFLMENSQLSGAFNLTSPDAVTMKQLCQAIGRILKKTCWLPIPALALRLVFGKMADEMLLTGQRVLPNRLSRAGFSFAHPNIAEALEIVSKTKESYEINNNFRRSKK
jgi:uncharacterized protein